MTTSIERLYGPGEDKFAFFTYSRSEAARMLGVDIQTIDGLIASRQLRASRIGKPGSKRPRVAVRAASLEARLAWTSFTLTQTDVTPTRYPCVVYLDGSLPTTCPTN